MGLMGSANRVAETHPLCSRVLILNPSVGLIVSMSSPLTFFKMVVLPALSSPLEGKEGGEGGGLTTCTPPKGSCPHPQKYKC